MQRLVAKDAIQKRHLSDAVHAEQSARGARDAARAERDVTAKKRAAAQLTESALVLRAPADGVVLTSPRAQGTLVSPARGTLFTIGDTLDELRLEAHVAEADIGAVAPGQNARFTVPAFTDEEFTARVERVLIEPERREGAVSYRVALVAGNRGGRLLPGMTANVSIAIAEGRDVLAVREAALRFTPEEGAPAPPRTRVWKSTDGVRLSAVEVRPGITDGAYTEVVPAGGVGLAPGEPVVVGLIEAATADDTGPGVRLGGR
jgi:HlyD family secretion protein